MKNAYWNTCNSDRLGTEYLLLSYKQQRGDSKVSRRCVELKERETSRR